MFKFIRDLFRRGPRTVGEIVHPVGFICDELDAAMEERDALIKKRRGEMTMLAVEIEAHEAEIDEADEMMEKLLPLLAAKKETDVADDHL